MLEDSNTDFESLSQDMPDPDASVPKVSRSEPGKTRATQTKQAKTLENPE